MTPTLLVAVYEFDEMADAIKEGNDAVSSSSLMPVARYVHVSPDAANAEDALVEALAEVRRADAPMLSSWRIDKEDEVPA